MNMYDLAIIGGGPGGYVAAERAGAAGLKVVLFEKKSLGGGVYAFVPYMGLSLTYDHRAVDGGEATRFLKQVATEIENLEVSFE